MGDVLKLKKCGEHHKLVQAFRQEYTCGDDSVPFLGVTEMEETAVFFVNPDGSALGLISKDPDTFCQGVQFLNQSGVRTQHFSDLMDRGCPSEAEFEPGAFDPGADEISAGTTVSLY